VLIMPTNGSFFNPWSVLISGYWSTDYVGVSQMAHGLPGG
jgi:hypothetical protein